jgi:hypothetical protein
MVSRFEQRHRSREDGGHTRGGSHARLRTFQCRQPILERRDRGIGEARVDVAGLVALEPGGRLSGVLKYKARRKIERLGVLVKLAAGDSGADRQRIDVVVLHSQSPKEPIKKPVELSLRRVLATL